MWHLFRRERFARQQAEQTSRPKDWWGEPNEKGIVVCHKGGGVGAAGMDLGECGEHEDMDEDEDESEEKECEDEHDEDEKDKGEGGVSLSEEEAWNRTPEPRNPAHHGSFKEEEEEED